MKAITTSSAPSDSAAADAAVGWTFETYQETSTRQAPFSCVRLTNAGQTSVTCLTLPGVQRWMVGGTQFALSRGAELRFDDGDTVPVDSNRLAVAPVRGRQVIGDDQSCDPPEIGQSIAAARDAAPATAWMIVRCAPDKAAVLAFNWPHETTGYLVRSGGTWKVVLVTDARDACRTVSAIAEVCASVAL